MLEMYSFEILVSYLSGSKVPVLSGTGEIPGETVGETDKSINEVESKLKTKMWGTAKGIIEKVI